MTDTNETITDAYRYGYLLSNVVLYKPQVCMDAAVVFSSIVNDDGTIKRRRLYRIYSGHGYNRPERSREKAA
ncbi:hypothetical protein [Methanococcoides sp. FTZ1]|uniref:hypothetical protein n=1 Tax=Methanococcoides sp. FTZ1 TaxID=3439061 RepID=UPI003F87BAC5